MLLTTDGDFAHAVDGPAATSTVTGAPTEDGSAVGSWRESYGLTRTDGGWRIFSSIDHAA